MLADEPLLSGRSVAQLANRSDTVVVLLYSPEDCVACYGVLSEWLEWGVGRDSSVALILNKTPTDAEGRQLHLYGLKYDVLAGMGQEQKFYTPATHLFVGGAPVAIALVKPGRDFVLNALSLSRSAPPLGAELRTRE